MAVKRVQGSMNVVQAAEKRIRNVFSNGVPVYLSLSGGKDSICIADITLNLIKRGEVDPKQLICIFIDEEAIYDCCIDAMKYWRKQFLLVGAKFWWFCLPLKQVSCFNHLTNEESWITWEPGKEDVWVRKPPAFAIMRSPYLHKVGEMNYQTFARKICKDGITITGVRTAESVQRLQYMAELGVGRKESNTNDNMVFPIYDWKDKDVWLYIKEHHLDIPEAYIWIYREGENAHSLRISNFFGADSLRGLRHVAETDPDLWARIEKREPNAYLVLMYWDSEMFKRSSRERKKLESTEEQKDYKALLKKYLWDDYEKNFTNPTLHKVAKSYKNAYIKMDGMARMRDYRKMYEALIGGDPKLRSLRAVYKDIAGAYSEYAKKFRKEQ